jgi:zinc transporter 7
MSAALEGPTSALLRKFYYVLGDDDCGAEVTEASAKSCGAHGPPPALSAVLATLLISLAPLIFLPFLPAPTPGSRGAAAQPLLLCFAAGGLLGDVFLHTLPHNFGHSHGGHHHHPHSHGEAPHDHGPGHDDDGPGHDDHGHGHDDHGHGHTPAMLGLAILGGFITFYVVEKLVRAIGSGGHGHSHGHAHDHSHAHSHAPHDHDHDGGQCDCDAPPPPPPTSTAAATKRRAKSPQKASAKASGKSPRAKSPAKSVSKSPRASSKASAEREHDHVHDHGHDHGHDHEHTLAAASPADEAGGTDSDRWVAGYLNLAADAAHNFTDGLALGAAWRVGAEKGIPTTLAVLFHEVPHEVGDVAILMQVGFTKWEAIRSQLFTAVGALLGALLAVSTGRESAGVLSNFTAGGFIYIATVSVLPQLLVRSSISQILKEVCAMAAGIGLMLAVLKIEERGGHSH